MIDHITAIEKELSKTSIEIIGARDGPTYAILTGDVKLEIRRKIQDKFNSDDNKHGAEINLILTSSIGAEGLDLKNVRHIHIMEPYWNWARIKQVIARGVRNDSHKLLADDEKNVTPYIYLAVPPEAERLPSGELGPTTDTELYDRALLNHITISSFIEACKEVSIECMVNGEDYCRACSPTDQPLYTNNAMNDVRSVDPCSPMMTAQVHATEIIVDDIKYYYVPDPDELYDYKIFIFDKDINAYRILKSDTPIFIKIIKLIMARDSEPADGDH
jgi:hypothetical protein